MYDFKIITRLKRIRKLVLFLKVHVTLGKKNIMYNKLTALMTQVS